MHYDLEFPRNIAQGCQGAIERRGELVTLASGHEEGNQRWVHSRRVWNAGLGIRSRADLENVVALFEEVRGYNNSFALFDWLDHASRSNGAVSNTDQPLGAPIASTGEYEPAIGDGSRTTFQLVKRYGTLNPYLRPISLPDTASVVIAADGTPQVGSWTLTPTGGAVTFDTAPGAGVVLTAGYTFRVPVRFAENSIAVEWVHFRDRDAGADYDVHGAGSAPDIQLIEKRLDGVT